MIISRIDKSIKEFSLSHYSVAVRIVVVGVEYKVKACL